MYLSLSFAYLLGCDELAGASPACFVTAEDIAWTLRAHFVTGVQVALMKSPGTSRGLMDLLHVIACQMARACGWPLPVRREVELWPLHSFYLHKQVFTAGQLHQQSMLRS